MHFCNIKYKSSKRWKRREARREIEGAMEDLERAPWGLTQLFGIEPYVLAEDLPRRRRIVEREDEPWVVMRDCRNGKWTLWLDFGGHRLQIILPVDVRLFIIIPFVYYSRKGYIINVNTMFCSRR